MLNFLSPDARKIAIQIGYEAGFFGHKWQTDELLAEHAILFMDKREKRYKELLETVLYERDEAENKLKETNTIIDNLMISYMYN